MGTKTKLKKMDTNTNECLYGAFWRCQSAKGCWQLWFVIAVFLGLLLTVEVAKRRLIKCVIYNDLSKLLSLSSDPTTYNVPTYEEVVSSSEYPVRQSNLRQSTSHLPSYEDIIAAVENEGTEPANNTTNETPVNDQPAAAEPPSEPAGLTSNPSMPTRSASRASRLLRPLRVRRIKSDKLHLKDFRLQIRTPTQNPVTIEPITPPPQYEDKMPELK